jgi:hypothetical protein
VKVERRPEARSARCIFWCARLAADCLGIINAPWCMNRNKIRVMTRFLHHRWLPEGFV